MGQCAGSKPNTPTSELEAKTNSKPIPSNTLSTLPTTQSTKAEAIIFNLTQKIIQLTNRLKKIDSLIEKNMDDANRLLEIGSDQSKREAKRKVTTVAAYRKQVKDIQLRIKLLQDQKIKVQTHQLNAQTIDVIENANNLMEVDYTQKIQEIKFATINQRSIQQQIGYQLEGMLDEELEADTDQLFEQLEKKVQRQKKKMVSEKSMEVNVGEKNNNLTVGSGKRQVKDDIDAMLQELEI